MLILFLKKSVKLLICVFLSISIIANAKYDLSNKVAFRQNLNSCNLYFSPIDFSYKNKLLHNDQSAFLLGAINQHNWKEKVIEFLDFQKNNHPKSLYNSIFYITGFSYKETKDLEMEINSYIKETEYARYQISFKFLKISKYTFIDSLRKLKFEEALFSLRDFLPSKSKDYQRFYANELMAKLASLAMIEAGLFTYIFTSYPSKEAIATASVHASLLLTMSILNRSISNWILRSKTKFEQFFKSSLLSLPYILNFNISSQLSHIQKLYEQNGLNYILEKFPDQVLIFMQTQSLSAVLQTLFYQTFYYNGTQAWSTKISDPYLAQKSRTFISFIEMPILALDAVALAHAGANVYPLADLGFIHLNLGHIELASLIAFGFIVQKNEKALDKAFEIYLKLNKKTN